MLIDSSADQQLFFKTCFSYLIEWVKIIFKEFLLNENEQKIKLLADIVKFYASKLPANIGEDLRHKLAKILLEQDEKIVTHLNLTLFLMNYRLISVAEWDRLIAVIIHDSLSQLDSSFFEFIRNIFEVGIKQERIIQQQDLPSLTALAARLSKDNKGDRYKVFTDI
jgi:hypothetical protein